MDWKCILKPIKLQTKFITPLGQFAEPVLSSLVAQCHNPLQHPWPFANQPLFDQLQGGGQGYPVTGLAGQEEELWVAREGRSKLFRNALLWVSLMGTNHSLAWPWPYRVSRRADPVLCYRPLTQLLMSPFYENDLFHKHIHSFIPSHVSVFAKTQALGHYTSIAYRIRFLNFSPWHRG